MNGELRNHAHGTTENGSVHSKKPTSKETTSKKRTSKSYGVVNAGEEEQMEVTGYVRSPVRHVLLWIGIILTVGLLRLVLHWWPYWRLFITHTRCSLAEADTLLIVENYQGKFKTRYVESVVHIQASDYLQTAHEKGYDNPALHLEGLTIEEEGIPPLPMTIPSTDLLRVHLNNGTFRDARVIRGVWVKKLFYIWDDQSFSFIRLAGLEQGFKAPDFHASTGLPEQQQKLRQLVYGLNEIIVPVQSILNMVIMEVLDPFYMFQAFSLTLWFIDGYIFYPIAIIGMTTFGVSSYVIQTRKSQRRLYETVHATGIVTVCRSGDDFEEIPFNQLVPGDVLVIPMKGCLMQCDAVLLNGQCIMNESMLTGESVPVSKSALPRYHEGNHSPHTLFCGTEVIQARSSSHQSVKAVVLRTGYLTSKGGLVRSILYPPPADFQFEKDSYKFIWLLAVVAVLGLIYTVVAKYSRGIAAGDLIVKALDLLTICIPPALPAAMTVGKIFAQKRLERSRIYCINSRVINVSGGLDCMCFDKTGTLTENGLDFFCAVPTELSRFKVPVQNPVADMKNSLLLKGMAVSHSLTIIENKISGDPLDIKMFESSGWILEEPAAEGPSQFDPQVRAIVIEGQGTEGQDMTKNTTIELFHQFTFDSTLQRMSIVTKQQGSSEYVLYCKGSPEMITSLSKEDTVPSDMLPILQGYTQKGYRVIGIGRRVLEETSYAAIQRKGRSDYENNLDFLGIIVLENRVKPETAGVIEILKRADIKVVMITGDNMETAISVARECEIIGKSEQIIHVSAIPRSGEVPAQVFYTPTDTIWSNCELTESGQKMPLDHAYVNMAYKFAMTGNTWKIIRNNFPDLVRRLVTRGVVFARMSSDQKQQLVQELKEVGYCVGMCGDGANDCGALKAANVGISLSEAESSVASPFTAKEDNISCVTLVIKEGRAALTTAFGIFKFMVVYSLIEFFSVFILYAIESNLTDFQFLFIDIFLVLQFAITFGMTEAYTGELVKETPLMSLLSIIPITSILLQVFIMTGLQIAAYFTVQVFPWFEHFQFDEDANSYACYENYAVFGVSMSQYLIMVFVFSTGAPYRKRFYTNYILTGSLIVMIAIITYMAIDPAQWLANLMELKIPPEYDFRFVVIAFWLVNLVVSYAAEDFFCGYLLAKKMLPRLRNVKNSPKKYLAVELELEAEADWPLTKTISSDSHLRIRNY